MILVSILDQIKNITNGAAISQNLATVRVLIKCKLPLNISKMGWKRFVDSFHIRSSLIHQQTLKISEISYCHLNTYHGKNLLIFHVHNESKNLSYVSEQCHALWAQELYLLGTKLFRILSTVLVLCACMSIICRYWMVVKDIIYNIDGIHRYHLAGTVPTPPILASVKLYLYTPQFMLWDTGQITWAWWLLMLLLWWFSQWWENRLLTLYNEIWWMSQISSLSVEAKYHWNCDIFFTAQNLNNF